MEPEPEGEPVVTCARGMGAGEAVAESTVAGVLPLHKRDDLEVGMGAGQTGMEG
jgi:hypothetical protein